MTSCDSGVMELLIIIHRNPFLHNLCTRVGVDYRIIALFSCQIAEDLPECPARRITPK